MQASSDLVTRIGERLLQWRWIIMVLLGLFNIAVETVERKPGIFGHSDTFYVIEIVLFGVFIPLFGGISLTLVSYTRSKQQRADHHLRQHKALLTHLADMRDWNELVALVIRFPRRVVQLQGACLLLYDQASGTYHLETQWWMPNLEASDDMASRCRAIGCSACKHGRGDLAGQSFPARCPNEDSEPEKGTRYCLPLVYGSRPIALLYLYLPPQVSLAEDQAAALGAMAGSAAIALHDAQPQRSAQIQAEATEAERRRIARDLHDTLGQNISYLRLKLDQLTGDDALHEIRAIRQELEQMRAVAGEAYIQVRSTLSELQTPATTDVETALQQQARQVAARAGFALDIVREGVPRSLPPQTQRQVLYLLREALKNVERHAGPCHVEMRLVWSDDGLDVHLSDDGCGFDPESAQPTGHFGLGIMQQRAMAIDGRLAIASAPGSGTHVSLSLPIPRYMQAQAGQA